MFNIDQNKVKETKTTTINLNYDNEYHIGTIFLDEDGVVFRVQYIDIDGNDVSEGHNEVIFFDADNYKKFLFEVFKQRMEARYKKLKKSKEDFEKFVEKFK